MIFDYEVIQFGLEKKGETSDVITEIRFLHTIRGDESEPINIKKLYVIHLEYGETTDYFTPENINKDDIKEIIETKLGENQINHMKKLIEDEYNANVKKYVNVTL